MMLVTSTMNRLWDGRLRRVFRPLMRRTLVRGDSIVFGPSRGLRFPSGIVLGPERKLPFGISYYTYLLGLYEPHIQQVLLQWLRPGGVFYDAGASIGFFSLVAARAVGPEGRVFAFEPFAQSAQRLRELMSLNSLQQCSVIEAAVADSEGTTDFFVAGSGNAATPSLFQGDRAKKITVPKITLDRFAVAQGHPDVIKLDVEGAETLALRGASKLLASNHPPRWIIEIHSEACDREVNQVLRSFGYTVNPLGRSAALAAKYPCHRVAFKEVCT